ncbi:phosphatidate cytidylyltransferase [Aquabacterium sp. OR-4]|uniref:phosphatidate cytidylyltransferase n=1 Tax=Aquabacterium sp. OR-4 TaxID=2978127 RepID=UPI0021B36D3C|nr:phosphatidate cytidylyltransferase [Aquabacterium sp. OR-4]MDT7837191.1 phosphatidate cytidylyltransferase [Aquabacterium sp. OR-4]
MSWLRSLDARQQVALLFVVLFGLLALASAATAMLALRERDAQQAGRFARAQRDLRAVWIGAVVFWLAWVSGAAGATLLFGVISFLALREYITLVATRRSDHRSLLLAFFVVLPLQFALVGWRRFDLFSVFIPVYMFLAIPVISALAGDPERFLERNAKIQWGITVCVYGLSHAPALLLLNFPKLPDRGAFLLFFLVMVTAAAQLAQEAASRRLRRRPVARHIDRSFSLRAWGSGVLAGALLGALLFWITPFKLGQALVMAAIAGGAGTLGDFVMRALKKDAGVRWWGNESSVTGAVGLLDRVAPLCFAAPVFFHSVRWYFQLQPS